MSGLSLFELDGAPRLNAGDQTHARAVTALRLADNLASVSLPHYAKSDGGESQTCRIWDLHFVTTALSKMPIRPKGLCHMHCGWPGLDRMPLQDDAEQTTLSIAKNPNSQSNPQEVQATILAAIEACAPDWTIVLTRVLNAIPDPTTVINKARATRIHGASVIMTALAGPDGYVFDAGIGHGLVTPDLVAAMGTNGITLVGLDGSAEDLAAGAACLGLAFAEPTRLQSLEAGFTIGMKPLRELTYDLKPVRTLHSLECTHWLGRASAAYWCEWDHYGETPRSFGSIVDGLVRENWPRFIKSGSVVVDVGGHSGDTAIPMGLFAFDREMDRPGTVIVVEPNPEVLKVMAINLAMNAHVADFRVAAVAITGIDIDEIELSDHGNAHCNGGIVRGERYSEDLQGKIEAASVNRYKARGVTLETLLREQGVNDFSTVSFIKTDCEGFDKEILRGSAGFLAIYKPTLFVEWFAWFSPEDDADFFAAIEEIGYVGLYPDTLERASATIRRTQDLLCIHASKVDELGLNTSNIQGG